MTPFYPTMVQIRGGTAMASAATSPCGTVDTPDELSARAAGIGSDALLATLGRLHAQP